MKQIVSYFLVTLTIGFVCQTAYAQSNDQKKFAVGVQFSILGINDPHWLSDLSPEGNLALAEDYPMTLIAISLWRRRSISFHGTIERSGLISRVDE